MKSAQTCQLDQTNEKLRAKEMLIKKSAFCFMVVRVGFLPPLPPPLLCTLKLSCPYNSEFLLLGCHNDLRKSSNLLVVTLPSSVTRVTSPESLETRSTSKLFVPILEASFAVILEWSLSEKLIRTKNNFDRQLLFSYSTFPFHIKVHRIIVVNLR